MGGVSNVDIDGNNTLYIKGTGAVISTFETLPDAHSVETMASATTDVLSTVRSLVRPDTRCDTPPRLAPSSAQPRHDWSHRRASPGAVPLARAPLRCSPRSHAHARCAPW